MFFRKKQKQLRKLIVPAEHAPELCRLWDTSNGSCPQEEHISRYNLWKFIESLFPSEDFINPMWSIKQGGTQITIYEV